jgi:hypothetical protein
MTETSLISAQQIESPQKERKGTNSPNYRERQVFQSHTISQMSTYGDCLPATE